MPARAIVRGPPFEADPCGTTSRGPPGAPQGHCCLSVAPRAERLPIRQRIPAATLDPGIPRRCWKRGSPACRDRETGCVTEDGAGTSVRGGRRVPHGDRGSGPQAGQTLDRGSRTRRGGSAMLAGASPSLTSGPFPFHVAFVEDRLLSRSTPAGGVRSPKIQENSISVFCWRARHFPSRTRGPLKVRPAGFGKYNFPEFLAE